MELLQEEKEELKARFFREGGIEQARREQLLKEQAEAEKIKTETNGKIKSFVLLYILLTKSQNMLSLSVGHFVILRRACQIIIKIVESEEKSG